jgi:accessory Sec system S-layer assembly protein
MFKKDEQSIINNDSLETAASLQLDAIKPKVSFNPNYVITDELKYVYKFLNNELSDLQPNQISVSGIDLKKADNSLLVTAFIRHTLDKEIKLEPTTFLILNDNNEVVAKQSFDLLDLGPIPPRSSRPYEFVFENAHLDLISEDLNWNIAFEIRKEHDLDLDENWERNLTLEKKQALKKIISNLPKVNDGEINFTIINSNWDNDNLNVTILIRNGHQNSINISTLPLKVRDMNNNEISSGVFNFDSFSIKGNASKPWTFVFPSELIKSKPDNLNGIKISLLQ